MLTIVVIIRKYLYFFVKQSCGYLFGGNGSKDYMQLDSFEKSQSGIFNNLTSAVWTKIQSNSSRFKYLDLFLIWYRTFAGNILAISGKFKKDLCRISLMNTNKIIQHSSSTFPPSNLIISKHFKRNYVGHE